MKKYTQAKVVTQSFLIAFFFLATFVPAQAAAVDTSSCGGFGAGFSYTLKGSSQNAAQGLPAICSASDLIQYALNLALGFAAIVTVVFLILGGFWYLTSAGNEEQAEKGRKTLINAVIGLVVIIMSFAIVRIVASTLSGSLGGTTAPTSGSTSGGSSGQNGSTSSGGGQTATQPSVSFTGADTVSAFNEYQFSVSVPAALASSICNSTAPAAYVSVQPKIGGFLKFGDLSLDNGTLSGTFTADKPINYGYGVDQNQQPTNSDIMPIRLYVCGIPQNTWNIKVDSSVNTAP